MLAEFLMQHRDQLAQALAVPGHHFRKQKGAYGCVALRKMQFRSDAAAFLAAQQDVTLEHAVADVLEPDGRFPYFAAELCGNFVDHLGDGKRFCDVARELSRPREVPEEDGKYLVRGNESAVLVHRSD